MGRGRGSVIYFSIINMGTQGRVEKYTAPESSVFRQLSLDPPFQKRGVMINKES